MSNKREIAKIAKEIKALKEELNKTAAPESLGILEYYPVTTKGRTTYEVIIDWEDNKVWRSPEAYAISGELNSAINEALTNFSKKHPNLRRQF